MAQNAQDRLQRTGPWFDATLIAAACAIMLVWTWGKWADVFIDWGRELYIPWQITEGRVLYRDLAYLNGPLSPYFNAALFRLLGVGMRTLVLANIALLGGTLFLLYRILRAAGSRFSATAGCVIFALIFGIGTQRATGNYNNICPYSHELTHGAVLAFGFLALLIGARDGLSRRRAACAGVLLGLLFLTKPETFVATAGAGLIWFCLNRPGRRAGFPVLLAALAPIAVAFALLASAMPAGPALYGMLGAWPAVLGGIGSETEFYRGWAGLDFPGYSILMILAWTAGWIVALVPFALISIGGKGRDRLLAALGAALPAVAVALLFRKLEWMNFGRPLPVVLLALAWLLTREKRRAGSDRARAVAGLTLLAYALLMLAKLGLYPRIFLYGWALGMPAMMVVIVGLLDWTPAWVTRRGGSSLVARTSAITFLVLAVGIHLTLIAKPLRKMNVRVGTGADAFLADPRGIVANEAIAMIEANVGPQQTLAVVPEGVILNYLTRRPNPTPYHSTIPIEMILYGEDAIVEAFAKAPPDFLAFAHRPTPEYGLAWAYFSGNYGVRLGEWLHDRYQQVGIVEDPVRPDIQFGWVMLLRREAPP